MFSSPLNIDRGAAPEESAKRVGVDLAIGPQVASWAGMYSFNYRSSISLSLGRVPDESSAPERFVLHFSQGVRASIPESGACQKVCLIEEGLRLMAETSTSVPPQLVAPFSSVITEVGQSLYTVDRDHLAQMDWCSGSAGSFDVKEFRLAERPSIIVGQQGDLVTSLHPYRRELGAGSGSEYGFLKRERDVGSGTGKSYVFETLLTIPQAAAEVRDAMTRQGSPLYEALQKLSA